MLSAEFLPVGTVFCIGIVLKRSAESWFSSRFYPKLKARAVFSGTWRSFLGILRNVVTYFLLDEMQFVSSVDEKRFFVIESRVSSNSRRGLFFGVP